MASGSKNRSDSLRLGFLTAVELQDGGFVGGLLVTDRFGRPLEFQCTTPVRANRTQELLYGPTLEPFILGDLIGRTLIDRISIKPTLVMTNRPEMLPLRLQVEIPVLCLSSSATGYSGSSIETKTQVTLGASSFVVHDEFSEDVEAASQLGKPIDRSADLSEPIERVAEALKETMATVGGKAKVA
ncbi:MAG: hypothetical protein ACYTGL_28860 [Planctomycetota bacterium]